MVMLDDRRHASSEEQIERLIQTEIDAIARQYFRKAAAAQHLTIDQYAVTVENDEIGLDHRAFPINIRAYTPELGNNPYKQRSKVAVRNLPPLQSFTKNVPVKTFDQGPVFRIDLHGPCVDQIATTR